MTAYAKGVSHVNYACQPLVKGAPKSTTDGADLGRDATNTKMVLGHNPKELSPSATKNSRNRG